MNHKKAQKKTQKSTKVFCAFSVFFCAFLWFTPSAQPEIIDRILATVDNNIITLSDLRQERLIRAALRENTPNEDRELLNDLIERTLMVVQLGEFPGIDANPEAVTELLNQVQDRHGLSEEKLRNAIGTRLRISNYIDVRFRQFVRVTDEDVKKYYEDVFVPEMRRRGAEPPPLAQMADDIRDSVMKERLSHEIDLWLESVRRRSDIEIHQ